MNNGQGAISTHPQTLSFIYVSEIHADSTVTDIFFCLHFVRCRKCIDGWTQMLIIRSKKKRTGKIFVFFGRGVGVWKLMQTQLHNFRKVWSLTEFIKWISPLVSCLHRLYLIGLAVTSGRGIVIKSTHSGDCCVPVGLASPLRAFGKCTLTLTSWAFMEKGANAGYRLLSPPLQKDPYGPMETRRATQPQGGWNGGGSWQSLGPPSSQSHPPLHQLINTQFPRKWAI